MDTKTKELVVRLQKDPNNLEALRELRLLLVLRGRRALERRQELELRGSFLGLLLRHGLRRVFR